jgi:hypothetical protein
MSEPIEDYLAQLARELHRRGARDARLIDEARDHLADDIERRVEQGLAGADAQREAIARFGQPEIVAKAAVSERYRAPDGIALALAALVGIAVATVDVWTRGRHQLAVAGVLTVAAAMFGAIAPRHPWRWAIALWMWLPIYGVMSGVSPANQLARLLVFDVLLVVAYLAREWRPAPALATPGHRGPIHVRDRRPSPAFAVTSKRGRPNPELAAILANPDALLVPFLERMAPAPLGPLGPMQSVTALGDPTAPTRKYRVVFGERPSVECTVEIASPGTFFSVHWARTGDTAE